MQTFCPKTLCNRLVVGLNVNMLSEDFAQPTSRRTLCNRLVLGLNANMLSEISVQPASRSTLCNRHVAGLNANMLSKDSVQPPRRSTQCKHVVGRLRQIRLPVRPSTSKYLTMMVAVSFFALPSFCFTLSFFILPNGCNARLDISILNTAMA